MRNLANQIRRIYQAKEAEELGGVAALVGLRAAGRRLLAPSQRQSTLQQSSRVALLLCSGERELVLVTMEEACA